MRITASVGRSAANRRDDTRTIQKLLNKARLRYPAFRLHRELVEDGLCGEQTVAIIEAFQRLVLSYSYPDGKVDPGGKTWKKLNANFASRQEVEPLVVNWMRFLPWFDQQVPAEVQKQTNEYSLLVSKPAASPAKAIVAFKQGDSQWASKKLGNSSSKTVHGYGCAMTSLAMAATYLGSATNHWPANQAPKDLTPLVVNSILKKAGTFVAGSHMLWIEGGAKALGMKPVDSGVGVRLQAERLQAINSCLASGGLVMVHVDYKSSWKGDHWILLTNNNGNGAYTAIDPAYGKSLKLYTTPDAGIAKQDHVLLYGRNSSFAETTPANVVNYRVVRFVTLN